jgi:hypothetical protein
MDGKLVLDGVTYNQFLADMRSIIKEEIEEEMRSIIKEEIDNLSFLDEWLTQEQAGKEIGLSRRQVQGLIEKGIIKANAVGKISRKHLRDAYTEIMATSSFRRKIGRVPQHQLPE